VRSDDFHGGTIAPKLITITLRRSRDSTPVQSWTFEDRSIIRVGRATDNNVILHSSVVSRYHLELQYNMSHWKLVSIGNNGTYLNGKLIEQVPVVSGMSISLAQSGPTLQIHVGETPQSLLAKAKSSQSRPPSKGSHWERQTFINKQPDKFRDRNEP
jgi:pSer/pThr/pTyr-binding forkhead associated (FHA) protein